MNELSALEFLLQIVPLPFKVWFIGVPFSAFFFGFKFNASSDYFGCGAAAVLWPLALPMVLGEMFSDWMGRKK